ncbi:glycosyltransferase family 2 protein [Histidinibacterium lentulum]|uniref:Glycosyltransferase family 2 protein n=1 Tax=Histidinibacterium lentulum TaxID=2480588 RepID=A0A3N2R7D6_9RHOB|nr:glycosyltransferase family 2 protein [Histidinibacterium lentulum]ROU03364.1 glycosyltransferase family 2 protein [Histidinibacterium lentulum]
MSGPRIVMTLLVRDEVDIVFDTLAWHLGQGVDHVIATDNGSSDGTTEILEDFAAAGALTLLHEPSSDYRQGIWHTRMAELARDRHGADWVLPTDADEFWMTTGDRPLRAALAAIPADVDLVRCGRRNLMGSREDVAAMDWPDALVWRADPVLELAEPRKLDPAPLDPPLLYYGLPSKLILNPARLVEIGRGAHEADVAGEARGIRTDEIVLYHAPFRDRAEFEASNARIADAVERDPAAGRMTSWKSRRWQKMSPEEAFAEALPDAGTLSRDIRSGRVRLDTRLRDAVAAGRAGNEGRLAVYGVERHPEPLRRDPLAPPVPVLVAGGDAGETAAVAERLRRLGCRRPPPADGSDPGVRIAALHRARLAAPDDPVTARTIAAELRSVLERYGSGGHGALIADPGLGANLDLWRALSEAGDLAPVLVRLTPRGAPQELGDETGGLPTLAMSAERLLAASPVALHSGLARLGLWLPLHLVAEDAAPQS